MKLFLVSAVAAGFLSSLSPPALAQRTTADYTEQRVGGDQVVTFGDDVLPGDAPNPYGVHLRRPPGAIRVGLIRPRVNFVSEMLKSVENL